MGGIGKSVLVTALCRDTEVRRAFHDGVIWVPIGQQPSPVALQRDVANALGGPGDFATESEGKDRLGQLLADRAVLLVLDDVWEAVHAEAFDVLGPRCRMVLTTCDAGLITALGGAEHQVHLLTEAESRHLLAEWAGQTKEELPDEALRIMEECDGLPLALSLCGALAREGNPWSDVLEALEEADLEFLDHPHGSVLRSIKVSVDRLSEDEARRFVELRVFPSDETVPEAAVMTLWQHTGAQKKRHAGRLLTTLVRRALVQVDGVAPNRRVSLHDLMRSYAERIAPDEQALHRDVVEAYRAVCPDGWESGPDDGYFLDHLPLHLARAELWNELSASLLSKKLGIMPRWVEQGMGRQGIECMTGLIERGGFGESVAASLRTQMARIHASCGEYDTATSLLEDVLAQTSVQEGRRAHAVALHEMGSLHLYRNEMEAAAHCYRQALELCEWQDDPYPDEAAANRVALATIAMRQYRWAEVVELAGRAAEEAEQADDPAHVAGAERLVGVALVELGRYDEAQSKFDGALGLAQRRRVTIEEARILLELGRLQYGRAILGSEAFADVTTVYEQALSVAERLGDLHSQVEANIGLGRCALAEGNTQDAAARFEESASRLPAGTHLGLLTKCRMGIAAAACQAGELAEASRLYAEATDFAEQNDFKWLFVTGLVGIGAVRWRQNAEGEAEQMWDKARREAATVSPHLESIAQAYITQCRGSSGVAPA